MRKEDLDKDKYYYLYNNSCYDSDIFIDDEDKARFMYLTTHFQSPIRIYNIAWYTKQLVKVGIPSSKKERFEQLVKNRNIELIAFSVNKKSFDVLIKNLEEGLASVYMQRILTSYSKYYNKKYNKKGHVFSGPYKIKNIPEKDLSLYSSYIHKKPSIEDKEINYSKYIYSSYKDYIDKNRWGGLLSKGVVTRKFKDLKKYIEYVRSEKELANV